MNLILEIEFLTGTCRAATAKGNLAPDWPPQPDRIFSALVSAWANRGGRPSERAALEWLESQPIPAIHAGGHTARNVPKVFVPPNDVKYSRTPRTYRLVMPSHRRLKARERRFPVAWLEDPLLCIAWPNEPAGDILEALNELAHTVGYIGHSASLARCHFKVAEDVGSPHHAQTPRTRVYTGRLKELEGYHASNPARPYIRAGAAVRPPSEPTARTPRDWLVLEAVGGVMPDIRAQALVCRKIRHRLMSGYRELGREHTIPEIVSGHTPDGSATRHNHLAIAPMAFVGFKHADARVLGFALIAPTGVDLRDVDGLQDAFEHVAPYRDRTNDG